MRRILESLLLCLFLCTMPLAAQAGEILEGEGEQIVRDLLRDLKNVGKVGKKTVGRGASGTLRSLLTSSDTVICGIWQAKQHNLMIELAVKRVPAETYRKAQRLGEIIDRACDKVVNPEAYRTGGSGSQTETEPEEEESEPEEEETESTDPEVICANRCLPEYSEWRKWVRSAEKWQRWVREAEAALKKTRADNKEAARRSRAAKADAKESRKTAERIKGEAEAAGWPAGSASRVGEVLQRANRDEAADRRLLAAWREAYAKISKAREELESAINMRDAMRRYAAEAEVIYRACVKKCRAALVKEGHASATLDTLRRFQANDPNRGIAASVAPVYPRTILATPGGRGRLQHRLGRGMTSGYADHVSGIRRPSHRVEEHAEPVAMRREEPQRQREVEQEMESESAMASEPAMASKPAMESEPGMEARPRRPRRARRQAPEESGPPMERVSVPPLVVEAGAAEF